MHPMAVIGPIIFGFIFILVLVYIFYSNHRIKERARKIDPTVKTIQEAEYVLKQNIAVNVGANKSSIYCKHCGKKIPEDSKFCKHCGKEQ